MPCIAQSLHTMAGPETAPPYPLTSAVIPVERVYKMTIINPLKTFITDESGAVTVDWVVLTAAIVGLGIVVMNTIGTGIESVGTKIANDLKARNAGYVSTP